MKNNSISRIWKITRLQSITIGKGLFSYALVCVMGVVFLSWLFNVNEAWPVLLKDTFRFSLMISVPVPLILTVAVFGVFGQQNLSLPASNLEKYIALLLNCLFYTLSALLIILFIAVPVMMMIGWIGYKETFSLGREVWDGAVSGFNVAFFGMLCCGFLGLGLALHRTKRHRFAYISSFFLAVFVPSIVHLITGIGKPVLEPYATVYFPLLGVAFLVCSFRNFRRIQLKATAADGDSNGKMNEHRVRNYDRIQTR